MKKGLKLLLIGAAIKVGSSFLQADSPPKTMEDYNEKPPYENTLHDTINLKKDYFLYDPCTKN